jgi:hypothetical protein
MPPPHSTSQWQPAAQPCARHEYQPPCRPHHKAHAETAEAVSAGTTEEGGGGHRCWVPVRVGGQAACGDRDYKGAVGFSAGYLRPISAAQSFKELQMDRIWSSHASIVSASRENSSTPSTWAR